MKRINPKITFSVISILNTLMLVKYGGITDTRRLMFIALVDTFVVLVGCIIIDKVFYLSFKNKDMF